MNGPNNPADSARRLTRFIHPCVGDNFEQQMPAESPRNTALWDGLDGQHFSLWER